MLGFQHVVALAGWWREQGCAEGEVIVSVAFGRGIKGLL